MEPFIGIIFIIIIFGAIFFAINEWRKNMALLRSVTDINRGTWSERKLIVKLLKLGIPAITVFHDLYVEKQRKQFSQIDAVVVTRVGIIVFEVKDYSGWIFGKGYQRYWTQVLAYGKEKHRFYNPVLQNDSHIESLKKQLSGIADVPFFSVIIFYGRCTLKNISYIPDNINIGYPGDVSSIIKYILETQPTAQYNDKWAVINTLKKFVANGDNAEIVYNHIKNIHQYSQY